MTNRVFGANEWWTQKIRWEAKSEKFPVWLHVDQQIVSVSYLVNENVAEVLIEPCLYVGCIV